MKKIAFLTIALSAAAPLAVFADQSTVSNSPIAPAIGNMAERQQLREQNRELRDQNAQARSEIKSQRQQNLTDRCQMIQNRLNERVTRAQENDKKTFTIAFSNILARLQRLATRLSADGVDVNQLNTDIAMLQTKISALQTAHDNFISNLQGVQVTATTDCGKTQGQFMAKLEGARQFNLTVEKDRLDIKSFIQTTIKSDIMAIRAKLATQKTEPTSETPTPATSNTPQQ